MTWRVTRKCRDLVERARRPVGSDATGSRVLPITRTIRTLRGIDMPAGSAGGAEVLAAASLPADTRMSPEPLAEPVEDAQLVDRPPRTPACRPSRCGRGRRGAKRRGRARRAVDAIVAHPSCHATEPRDGRVQPTIFSPRSRSETPIAPGGKWPYQQRKRWPAPSSCSPTTRCAAGPPPTRTTRTTSRAGDAATSASTNRAT